MQNNRRKKSVNRYISVLYKFNRNNESKQIFQLIEKILTTLHTLLYINY